MQHFGCAAGELFAHWRVRIAQHIRVAKQSPGQSDGIGIGQGVQQGGHGAIASVDIDEFIHIQRQDPIGLFDLFHLRGAFQGSELNAALIIGTVIAHMGQVAQRLQPVQHGVGAILTIV